MISLINVKKFCREGELEKIENYEQAINDKENMWVCHHRLELTLEGEFANYKKDLIRMGMYYNRPAFELIFMTNADHKKMHSHVQPCSNETKKKLAKVMIGTKGLRCGAKLSEETKEKLRQVNLGKKHSPEEIQKMREAQLKRWAKYRALKEANNG